jgi:cbb3-type cytochrome oxidase maturation protein
MSKQVTLNIKLITMNVIFMLISFSLLVAGSFLGAFLWAINDGQFEDDYSPSVRILYEDQVKPKKDDEE